MSLFFVPMNCFFFFRYKIIVYSANSRSPQKVSSAIMSLVIIWTLSILVSMPLFFAMNLEVRFLEKIQVVTRAKICIPEQRMQWTSPEWSKTPLSSQTDKLMAGTKFFDYLHTCSFIIATSLFYEVNDPLLQVCYKP